MLKLVLWRRVLLLCVLCAPWSAAAPAQTFKSLLSFDGSNGANPYTMSLVQGTDGNFYGTTETGGANDNCASGCGTVFKITAAGALVTLHSFDGADGEYPTAGLVLGTDGNFYGTTSAGGANNSCFDGCGTIFRITPGGTLTTLYSFCAQTKCADGYSPLGGLIQATDGNLYGTTVYGGANNPGTIFKITLAGALTTLYSFCGQTNCSDGADPYAGLVQGSDGNFYGTTSAGGNYVSYCGSTGCGTVFKITPQGTFTTIYRFCAQTNCADGEIPYAGLVQARSGNFYGTTFHGGNTSDTGTVFEISSTGTLTTLYSFCTLAGCLDGARPYAGLVQATDQNFYGTTYEDGANGWGTAYKITASDTLTTLHSFDGTDGQYLIGGLVQATAGSFYGTTYQGGSSSDGTVFNLSVGLRPFVVTVPTSGKTGTKVTILGNDLKGATSVTFDGVTATITFDSGSEIQTTVPAGATTGNVQVTTASGTVLTSNVKFRVP